MGRFSVAVCCVEAGLVSGLGFATRVLSWIVLYWLLDLCVGCDGAWAWMVLPIFGCYNSNLVLCCAGLVGWVFGWVVD